MKRILLAAIFAVGLWTGAAAPCSAEPTEAVAHKSKKGKTADKSAAPAELSPVAAALCKVSCHTESSPALDAKYYIFLYSTSSCAHCNRTMPDDVSFYKEMRRQGDVEMLLVTISQLDTPAAAKGFLDKYGAPFAGMLWEDMKAAGVPGAGGFQLPPGFVIVNSEGHVLHAGPGSVNGRNMLQDWKTYTIGADAEIPPPSAAEIKAQKKAEKEKARAALKADKNRLRAEKRPKRK